MRLPLAVLCALMMVAASGHAQSLSPDQGQPATPGCITTEAEDAFMSQPPGPTSVGVRNLTEAEWHLLVHNNRAWPAGFAARAYLMNNFTILIVPFENGCALNADSGSPANLGQ